MVNVKSIGRELSKVSLGLVLILLLGWIYVKAPDLFSGQLQENFKQGVLTYLLFASFIFSWNTLSDRKTERPLFEVSFLKAFPKFIIGALVTLGLLGIVYSTISGESLIEVFALVSGVGLSSILLYGFTTAILEQKVFFSFIPNELRARKVSKTITVVLMLTFFAIFHWWTGKTALNLLIYFPLGFIFWKVSRKYSPRTNMADSGVHFAWNIFVLGALTPIL